MMHQTRLRAILLEAAGFWNSRACMMSTFLVEALSRRGAHRSWGQNGAGGEGCRVGGTPRLCIGPVAD